MWHFGNSLTAAVLLVVTGTLPLQGVALTTGAAFARADGDLRQWIPRMRVKNALTGELGNLAREHRVVVVMTTIPPRIDRIEPVLDSMLAQTWPIEALHLSIPHKYNRTGETYSIPAWLRTKPGVTIARCEDLGPGTHLLNGLRLEKDPWTFLAVVDDDHIYSPDLVETLMRAALAQPGTAVAAQGFLSVPGLKIEKDSPRYLHDQGFPAGPVLVSYLGVVYQRGFFDDTVYDYSNFAPQCKYQDDMWFSAHLARKGIPRIVLGAALGVQELKDMHLGPSSLTFWQENKPRDVSTHCNHALLQQYNDLWVFRRRVVLALGGLPPLRLSAAHVGGLHAMGVEWENVAGALQDLPSTPDLVYLCTRVESDAPERERQGQVGSPRNVGDHILGASFRLGSVLVTSSDACQVYPADPRVGQLLQDPLRWEGDPNTVIILGAYKDLMAEEVDPVLLAACAAAKFDAYSDGDSASSVGTDDSPFCRAGEFAAVTVGSFGGSAR